ncbi:MAG: rhomboid family intramembrane serine protease [Prevotella sp.]|nr:rhomboid family intramembrane serine protease [Prevotella sp.]
MNSIPTVTKNLLIINILAFLAYVVLSMRGIDLNDMLGLHIFLASDFHIYQFVTYMFMHGGWTHLFFNMFALWMFGCVMERTWGPKKFLFYYIFCGIGAGIVQEIAQYVELYQSLSRVSNIGIVSMTTTVWNDPALAKALNSWTTVGASGAIYAILLGFGMTFPEERIFIFPLPVPIKAKWFVIGYAAIEVIMAYSSYQDGVAHVAHLGGMLFGFFLIKYWQKHPYSGSTYGRSSGEQFFKRFRNWGKRDNSADDIRRKTDWDYNADKKATEEEIDRILDKIRKNGYASLTDEEKKRLFDSSNKK